MATEQVKAERASVVKLARNGKVASRFERAEKVWVSEEYSQKYKDRMRDFKARVKRANEWSRKFKAEE